MLILAIDTSTRLTSVAVTEGDTVLAACEEPVDLKSENLLPLIDRVLAASGHPLSAIAAVAIGQGPGSFTGLRISFATAKGLCFAAGLPLRLVGSLAALAKDASSAPEVSEKDLLLPTLDAKRNEVFVAAYRRSGAGVTELEPPRVCAPADLREYVEAAKSKAGCSRAVIVGDSIDVYPEAFSGLGLVLENGRRTPSAGAIGQLAPHVDVAELATAEPAYIRASAAEVRFPNGNPGGPLSGQ